MIGLRLRRGPAGAPGRAAAFPAPYILPRRAPAALLVKLPEVAAVEVAGGAPEGVGRLLVRVTAARGFHAALNRIVLEEWVEVVHLGAVDGSARAVLGYLLGGKR